ncbi:hypothetical protein [Motiliproteus sp. SC1-56]|uniref:hypothetical protein n=1 Tax=Motiliproteus sp. SC1-56 TaxID=2799565 RepID=UPI001A8D5F48|nr:hypothetical protein [Motiliproteus sp. SC1-56]
MSYSKYTLAVLLLLVAITGNAASHVAPDAARIEHLDASLSALYQALERISEGKPDTATRDTLNSVQQRQKEARRLAEKGQNEQASALLEEAFTDLKIRIAAVRGGSGPAIEADAPSPHLEEKRRADLKHINDSLDALLGALVAIGEEKGRKELAEEIRTQVHHHQHSANALADRGALDAARAELDEALVTVKTAIATLRNRETLVRSLNFANKEEEYRYELDRYETFAMLIKLLTEKKSLAPATQAQMEAFQAQARSEYAEAQAAARGGDFETAVKRQEASNQSLIKAIRRGGVFIPG